MTKIRIYRGEFEGEMLYKGVRVYFWALRTDRGLQASFELPPGADPIPDMELFKALEAIIYGDD